MLSRLLRAERRPTYQLVFLLVAVGFCFSSVVAQQNSKKNGKNLDLSFDGSTAKVFKQIEDVELQAHVFTPPDLEAGEKRPCIIFFFGGGWRSGSPKQFEHHCRYFAERGMVAITAEYRVASRHGVKANACVADAKSAIRWVREHAQDLQVDPDRIVAGGGSAGGHLAACTGVVPGLEDAGENLEVSSRPNVLALFNPALILTKVAGYEVDEAKLEQLEERLGVPPEQISPYSQLMPGAPPTIIFHGEADTTVPYITAELYAKAMQQNGDRCNLEGFPEQGHGFFNYGRQDSKFFHQTVRQLDEFLVELGYLAAE